MGNMDTFCTATFLSVLVLSGIVISLCFLFKIHTKRGSVIFISMIIVMTILFGYFVNPFVPLISSLTVLGIVYPWSQRGGTDRFQQVDWMGQGFARYLGDEDIERNDAVSNERAFILSAVSMLVCGVILSIVMYLLM